MRTRGNCDAPNDLVVGVDDECILAACVDYHPGRRVKRCPCACPIRMSNRSVPGKCDNRTCQKIQTKKNVERSSSKCQKYREKAILPEEISMRRMRWLSWSTTRTKLPVGSIATSCGKLNIAKVPVASRNPCAEPANVLIEPVE